jgi:SAM-dependent methyltransferase
VSDGGAEERTGSQTALIQEFGLIDIYLFDQLVRGRITCDMRVLDAGCGPGRNSHYLMRCGAEVFGVDEDPAEIDQIRSLATEVAPGLPASNFCVGKLDGLPFADEYFDCVICNAVLHFAEDEARFEAMVAELWRVLASAGIFFARLASTIGIEDRVTLTGGRRFTLPDGTDRFLVDEKYLLGVSERTGGELIDPLKTTNVQNLRAMTTWVLRKP